MRNTTCLGCACGRTRIEVAGQPIASVECCCSSCGEAGGRMQRLVGAPRILTEHGATPFVMYRKDRVRFNGMENLREFRLRMDAPTRRVVAVCCNTPVFLEFRAGHWLSLYAGLWPDGTRPPLEMRTMTSDLPDAGVLPEDVPNAKKQGIGFFAKLFGAWFAMGFRSPEVPVTGGIDV